MTPTKDQQADKFAKSFVNKEAYHTAHYSFLKGYTACEQSMTDSEATVIQGWIAIDEAYGEAFLHEKKPILKNQPIADTGDFNCVWHSDSKTYLLDAGLFPDMDCESEPREVEITIKPKKK